MITVSFSDALTFWWHFLVYIHFACSRIYAEMVIYEDFFINLISSSQKQEKGIFFNIENSCF